MATKKSARPGYSISRRRTAARSITWCATVNVRGFKRTSKTLPDRKAVESWAADLVKTLRDQRTRGAVRPDVGSLTFAQVAAEYLKDEDVAAKTYSPNLRRQLTWWTNHYGNVRAREFSVSVIRDARGRLRHQHSPGTCNRYLSAARSCLNWARGSGLLLVDCAWPPKCMFKEAKHRERYLTAEELTRLLAAARAHSPLMFAAVSVAIGSGCRQGELLRLTWADVDLPGLQLTFRLTKAGEPRRVHLPKASADALAALRGKVAALSRHVFLDAAGEPFANYELLNRWEHVRAAAQLPGLRWHDLRHSTASFLVQAGASLPEIAMQLGHLNVATTARYAHLVVGKPVTGADKLNEKLGG